MNNSLRPYRKINITLAFLGSFIVALLFTASSYAQDLSQLGRFSVVNASGCAPLTVNITLVDNLGSSVDPQYYYDAINDPSNIELDTFHTYTQPGTYQLVQLTGATVTDKFDTLTIVVHELTTPQFRIHNCDNHRVRVEINEAVYDSYRVFFAANDSVDIGPNSFSPEYDYSVAGNYPISVRGLYNNAKDNCGSENSSVNTITTITPPILTSANVLVKDVAAGIIDVTQTIGSDIIYDLEVSINGSQNLVFFREVDRDRLVLNNLNTADNYFCYNIKTLDACVGTTFRSDTICTPKIGVVSIDGANTVTWETDTSVVDSYNIIRDNTIIAQINDPRDTTYADQDIVCKVEYSYQVQPVFTTGTSLSIDSSVTAFQTTDLPPLEFPFSTIINNRVELTWPKVDASIPLAKYIVEKSNNNRDFRTIASTDTAYYQDPDTTFFFTKKYRISYDDECDNRSTPSNETIPMLINQDGIRGNEVAYSWSKYETWGNGIRTYYLERIEDDGSPFEEIAILSGRSHNLVYSPNDLRPKKVRVRAESLDPAPQISYSNVIESELGLQIYFPTAFTPNDDGLNDDYLPKGPLVFNFEMEIYSRWGDLVFISNDIQKGWDGTFNDRNAKTGSYVYKVKYEDVLGNQYNDSGSFVLLRD